MQSTYTNFTKRVCNVYFLVLSANIQVKNQALKLLAELLQDPSSSADLKKEANAAVVAMG